LLALGGEQSFGEGGWLETPLSYLLPIAFDPNRNPRSARFSVKVRAQPTDAAIDHPAVKIGDGKRSAAALWQELPPVTVVNAVYPRAGAEILLSGDDRTRGGLHTSGFMGLGDEREGQQSGAREVLACPPGLAR